MTEPLRVACIGMGWWSDVLADAIMRSGKLTIAACYTRSEDKRRRLPRSTNAVRPRATTRCLSDPAIEAIINTTPNDVHLETTRQAADAGKHVFLDKPIANTVSHGRAMREVCRKAGVVLALGYQRRRESHFRYIKRRSRKARSASSSMPRPISAATGSARSTCRPGATRPPACRAA